MKGLKHTDEWKQWASESRSGDKNPFFGKPHSLESESFYTIEEYGDICIEKMEQTMVRTFPVVYT
jgi:hypothetical protein